MILLQKCNKLKLQRAIEWSRCVLESLAFCIGWSSLLVCNDQEERSAITRSSSRSTELRYVSKDQLTELTLHAVGILLEHLASQSLQLC